MQYLLFASETPTIFAQWNVHKQNESRVLDRTKQKHSNYNKKQKQLNAAQFHHYAKVQVNYNLSFCVIWTEL